MWCPIVHLQIKAQTSFYNEVLSFKLYYSASACEMVMWSPSQSGGFPPGTPVSSHTKIIRSQTSVPMSMIYKSCITCFVISGIYWACVWKSRVLFPTVKGVKLIYRIAYDLASICDNSNTFKQSLFTSYILHYSHPGSVTTCLLNIQPIWHIVQNHLEESFVFCKLDVLIYLNLKSSRQF